MMRWTLALVAILLAIPANAQDVAIDSAVYRESVDGGRRQIEPATRLTRGDRVVTILSWDAPSGGTYTVTSPVPAGLALQSASHPGLEVSTDGGRTWLPLTDCETAPRGTTHLRWRVGGDGRLSYRAVVR
jgi:hypothetical protein